MDPLVLPAPTLRETASVQVSSCSSGPGVIELTHFCLGDALPLFFWLPEATRAKLGWSAGFHVTGVTGAAMTGATVGLTVGTRVIVAVGRTPPGERSFYSESV